MRLRATPHQEGAAGAAAAPAAAARQDLVFSLHAMATAPVVIVAATLEGAALALGFGLVLFAFRALPFFTTLRAT